MAFHSSSVVGFGQLLNSLTASLTDGAPIAAALDLVRAHFAAAAVLLGVQQRGQERVWHVAGEATDVFPLGDACGRGTTDAALSQHFQILTASKGGTAAAYTLSILRALDAPRFDQEEDGEATVVVSQIARALDLASRLDSSVVEKSLYSSVLDRLGVGVILVDKAGRICSASAVAERFLGERDGLQMQMGALRAVNAADDRLLQAAIREAGRLESATDWARGVSLTKRSGARTLGLIVRPAAACSNATNARVAIYVRDCDVVPDVECEFVRQIFDLTPAEAAVTRWLTCGLSLEDAATSLDISRNTARAHLRSIFSKSGITRQAELVRLVLSSAALLGARPRAAA